MSGHIIQDNRTRHAGFSGRKKALRLAASFFLFLLLCIGPNPALARTTEGQHLQRLYREDKARFYAYPNGWGATPTAARRDLERVLSIYKNRPDYRIHPYVRIVPIARGVYQADGCCSFLTRPALVARGRK
jgi:hypothetical protein